MTTTTTLYTLLDNKGAFFASSVSIDALMTVMRGRWAGTIVDQDGKVLFDIEKDRVVKDRPGRVAVTAEAARAERDLAWSRA